MEGPPLSAENVLQLRCFVADRFSPRVDQNLTQTRFHVHALERVSKTERVYADAECTGIEHGVPSLSQRRVLMAAVNRCLHVLTAGSLSVTAILQTVRQGERPRCRSSRQVRTSRPYLQRWLRARTTRPFRRCSRSTEDLELMSCRTACPWQSAALRRSDCYCCLSRQNCTADLACRPALNSYNAPSPLAPQP